MTLDEFLLLLPKAENVPIHLPKSEHERHGIEDPEPYAPFVPPTLARRSPDGAAPAILLVSAPGAVGKTTLAREIARRIGSPLFHLGQVNVGHEFLTGAIARTFGDDQYSRVKKELLAGKRALVLDGLDEARLRAGEQNFEAFLERLADDFRAPSDHPALVLLGRVDTVADTAIWFELLGVPAARYEIEYFDSPAAIQFVAKYLDDRSKKKLHQRAPRQFDQARDAVLSRLEGAVPEGVHPRSLAGYAPVLTLVSQLLDVGDPFAEYQAILREAEKWRLETLVREIAGGLLNREHTKTAQKLRDELKSPPSAAYNWTNAYLPDEQCLRLLAVQTGYPIDNPPPSDLPAALREPYERKLKQWVGEHPFASQPLFMDYVYAWLFTEDNAAPELSSAVRAHLSRTSGPRPPYRPTPLLARFVADFAAGDAGTPQLRVEAGNFGFVYESVLSTASAQQRPKLTLLSAEESDELVGELTFGTSPAAPKRGHRLPVHLRDTGTGLWFWRRVSHADIQIAGELRIGGSEVNFHFGPDVEVEARTFSCESPVLRIQAPTRETAVFLTAQSYHGDAVEFLGTHEERLHLHINWSPHRHPWSRYFWQVEGSVPVGPEIRESFRRLRRILVCFRAEGYNDMARHEDLVENPAVTGSGLGRDVLTYCSEQRLLRRERPMYILDRSALDQLGINWADIRERRITQSIARFLQGFLDSRGS